MSKFPVPRLAVALVLFGVLAGFFLYHYHPPLSAPLAVALIVEPGSDSDIGPLIVAGRQNEGDFLFAKRVDATHLIFGYDSWGKPRVDSAPIPFTPGVPLKLAIELPTLAMDPYHPQDPPGRLRIAVEGATVFATDIHFYNHYPRELWLAENPLGGTACGPALRGRLLGGDGRELRGATRECFTLRERVTAWFKNSRQPYVTLLLCLCVALMWTPERASTARQALARALVRHRWFVGTATVATVLFGWMLTFGTFDVFRAETRSAFYDYQLASLLKGRLDLPEVAIDAEAFVHDNKLYGYFGPTPALLRLPFALFDFGFGELSRLYQLGYFVAALVAAYQLLRHLLGVIGRSDLPSSFTTVVWIGHLGLGTTLFFLSSRAYVYHEAILCGVTFALWSAYCAVRFLAAPAGARWWSTALLCGVLSVHARPPTGLFALSVLGFTSAALLLAALRRRERTDVLRFIGIGLLSVLGVLTFNGLSYLKFRSFGGAPLALNRQYHPQRLAAIDGKNFHAANLAYGFHTYFGRPGLSFEARKFPWFFVAAPASPAAFKAKIDLSDHTLSFPGQVPALCALAILGGLAALVRTPALRSTVAVVWLAALPMGIAMCAAIAIAERYTGDFVPFAICASALGLAVLESATPGWRKALRALFALGALYAILVTLAMTLRFQRELIGGMPEKIRAEYRDFKAKVDRSLAR